MSDETLPPIISNKDTDAPSVFQADALIREARRQKGLASGAIPEFCVLDPDGDILRYLQVSKRAERWASWPCYHSDFYSFHVGDREVGIVGCAVGAPYAVLIAEQMFALGCKFLISITSAGQIADRGTPPYFVVIERALRDEGTSYHYAPPAEFSAANPQVVERAVLALRHAGLPFHVGSSWTTDAPFRETENAVAAAQRGGILAVEMEASALYAFGTACQRDVLCLAHVTNRMGMVGEDFEKGEMAGALDALAVIAALVASFDRPHSFGESRPIK
jgi:uridine phosphorylase